MQLATALSFTSRFLAITLFLSAPALSDVVRTPRPDTAQNGSDATVVLSHWSVALPFTPSETDPQTIGAVTDPVWSWMEEGQRILAVNGMEIGHLNAMRAVLRLSTEPGDLTQLPVKLAIGRDDAGNLVEEVIVVPITQDTVLKNGMRFETRYIGTSWVSTLVQLPDTAVTDLRVGDRLMAMSDAPFDRRDSVQKLFQPKRRNGVMDYSVWYLRGDTVQVGTIKLGAEKTSGVPDPDVSQPKDMSSVEIMSHWSVRLPFAAAQGTAKTIGEVFEETTLTTGDHVVAINGMDVPHLNAIPAMLRLSTNPGDMTAMHVEVEVTTETEGQNTRKPLSLPITQDTVLANGLRFETVFGGDRWRTTLVRLPRDVDTDLRVGDSILAHGDGVPFNTRTSLRDTIRAERRAGKTAFSVVVVRDGDLMLCDFHY